MQFELNSNTKVRIRCKINENTKILPFMFNFFIPLHYIRCKNVESLHTNLNLI